MWYRGDVCHNIPAYQSLEPGHDVDFMTTGLNQISMMKDEASNEANRKICRRDNIWEDGQC